MTRLRLLWRNLRYFRAANLAVAAGVAVAAAALTGALMVGDSIRGSLTEMALRRLGPVAGAVTSETFVDADLAVRLSASTNQRWVPAVIVRGSAARPDGAARAAGIQIAAVGDSLLPVPSGACVLNGPLADALGVNVGDAVLLAAPRYAETPADAALGRRERSARVGRMRLRVMRIERDSGFAADFALDADQRAAGRAWVNLADLQRKIDTPGLANTLLVCPEPTEPAFNAGAASAALQREARLTDYGLHWTSVGDEAVLAGQRTYLPDPIADAADNDRRANQVLVALINHVENTDRGRTIHYAVAAGLSRPPGGALADDEIALNRWAAEQLGAAPGDRLTLSWYRRDREGAIVETHGDEPGKVLSFRVARVVPMTGLGAEPTLTPAYTGLTDASTIDAWDPPADLKIDKSLVTDTDEAYWDRHRAAPKIFVSLPTARRLWAGPYGRLNSLRLPGAKTKAFGTRLLQRLTPASMGLHVRPIREQQLAAAVGSSDFTGLFLALSFFVIASAALLTALLGRLAVEQRARQFGLMTALGFRRRMIRRLALAEGLLTALLGATIGLAGAVGYTAAIMAGLRTWWFGAMGSTNLTLHVEPGTLLMGLAASLAVAAAAVAWGVWRVGRTPPAALLAGRWAAASPHARRKRGPLVAATVLAASGAGVLAAGANAMIDLRLAHLLGGAVLLAAGMATLAYFVHPRRSTRPRIVGRWALARLAVANAGRRPTRTLLAAGLLAIAAFSLVTVGAFRQGRPADTRDKRSGAGGFALIARADIPLPGDLGSPAGRKLAGVRTDQPWSRARFVGLRRRDGQDASCLNITRPTAPTILAAPEGAFAGRFTFARALGRPTDPWRLLEARDIDGTIPVIADEATARWILHLDLGDTLVVTDGDGQSRRLKLVATLAGSIFQRELLMGEANFRRLYPAESGFGTVLAEVSPTNEKALARAMGADLTDYGLAVEPTAMWLARLREVANTYLNTFQTLGLLGLALGVAGLAVVLLRNLLESRAELALLTALGLSRRRRLTLALGESGVALIGGLAAGGGSATIASIVAAPGQTPLNWPVLIATTAGILLLGLATQAGAAMLAGRTLRPADLRKE